MVVQYQIGLDLVAAYLDDVVVAGDHLAVLEALRILHAAAPGLPPPLAATAWWWWWLAAAALAEG